MFFSSMLSPSEQSEIVSRLSDWSISHHIILSYCQEKYLKNKIKIDIDKNQLPSPSVLLKICINLHFSPSRF